MRTCSFPIHDKASNTQVEPSQGHVQQIPRPFGNREENPEGW